MIRSFEPEHPLAWHETAVPKVSPSVSPNPHQPRARAEAQTNHNPRVGGSSPSSSILGPRRFRHFGWIFMRALSDSRGPQRTPASTFVLTVRSPAARGDARLLQVPADSRVRPTHRRGDHRDLLATLDRCARVPTCPGRRSPSTSWSRRASTPGRPRRRAGSCRATRCDSSSCYQTTKGHDCASPSRRGRGPGRRARARGPYLRRSECPHQERREDHRLRHP
jgi:hypothetical protein